MWSHFHVEPKEGKLVGTETGTRPRTVVEARGDFSLGYKLSIKMCSQDLMHSTATMFSNTLFAYRITHVLTNIYTHIHIYEVIDMLITLSAAITSQVHVY